jgi:hypothetical protein
MVSPLTRLIQTFPLRPGRRARITGLCLVALSALSCILGIVAFSKDNTATFGWLPYLGSTVLFIIALYVLVPYRPISPAAGRLTVVTIALGLLILVLGIFMRIYRLEVQPFGIWNDEVDIGMIANRIISNPDFRPYIVPDNQTPLHFFGLVAFSFQLLGSSIIAIRIVTVLMGVASIIFAFLAGREAKGNRLGLLFAFAVAVSRWHINFSRFGVYTISVSCFGLLAIWFLLRARRTHQLHDFAWAGAALGFGLNFYIAARLTVIALFIYLFYEFLLAIWRKLAPVGTNPFPRSSLLIGLFALSVTLWLTTAPLVQYAFTNPDLYWGRSNEVSIFTLRDEPNLIKAIYKNTVTHLLMFNYHGDNNGRHNLPGEPMLDPAMGVFFVVGASLAIIQIRKPINFLMIVLFIVGLMGGILSLDFEAPQSTRAFNAIIPVLYFVALTGETLLRGIDRFVRSPAIRTIIITLASILIGGYIIYYNANTYFVKQANNDSVWYEYNGIETMTAYRMRDAFKEGTNIYGSVYLNNHIVIQFLDPDITGTQTLIPPNGFPLLEKGDKAVSIFVDRNSMWILEQVKLYYPDANIRIDTAPSGEPALYTVTIPAIDIQRLQGVTTRYWKGTVPEGQAAINQVAKAFAADWSVETPLPTPFVTQWDSTLVAPLYGSYQFNLQTPAKATLWLDNQVLISGSGSQHAVLNLPAGPHSLRLQALRGSGLLQLTWQLPDPNSTLLLGEDVPIPYWLLFQPELVPVQGLLGTYYNGDTMNGSPAFVRIDPFIDMYIHIIPLPRPYSVNWTGQINIPISGNWTFGLELNGQAQLFIDNQEIINAIETNKNVEGHIALSEGRHRITIHFLDNVGGSLIHLYWITPLGEKQIVPTTALEPSD